MALVILHYAYIQEFKGYAAVKFRTLIECQAERRKKGALAFTSIQQKFFMF